MPNWKKVIVSGSDANVTDLKFEKLFVPQTGSGSVPALAYDIPFLNTSSGDDFDQIFKDNQSKIKWYPAGALNVTGNIEVADHAANNPSYITASNIIASRHLTGSGLHINGLPVGSSETRVLVSERI